MNHRDFCIWLAGYLACTDDAAEAPGPCDPDEYRAWIGPIRAELRKALETRDVVSWHAASPGEPYALEGLTTQVFELEQRLSKVGIEKVADDVKFNEARLEAVEKKLGGMSETGRPDYLARGSVEELTKIADGFSKELYEVRMDEGRTSDRLDEFQLAVTRELEKIGIDLAAMHNGNDAVARQDVRRLEALMRGNESIVANRLAILEQIVANKNAVPPPIRNPLNVIGQLDALDQFKTQQAGQRRIADPVPPAFFKADDA